jgi:hypothetical protein
MKQVKAKIILRPTVSRPVYIGVRHPLGAHEKLLFCFFFLYDLQSVAGLLMWGAPSHERTGLSVVSGCCWAATALSLSGPTPKGFMTIFYFEVRSYFTTDGQLVCLGIEHPCGKSGQILLPVGMLLSEICGLVSVGRPLWREDGSAICSVITQWSELLRTRNHNLLSHLRLPKTEGPGSRIHIPQEQGGPAHILLFQIWNSRNLEGHIAVFISPRKRVAQLYPQAMGF